MASVIVASRAVDDAESNFGVLALVREGPQVVKNVAETTEVVRS